MSEREGKRERKSEIPTKAKFSHHTFRQWILLLQHASPDYCVNVGCY